MNLELNEEILKELVHEYEMFAGDGSYFYHLANYLIEELRKQKPELFN